MRIKSLVRRLLTWTVLAAGCDGVSEDARSVRNALTAPDVPWTATELLGRPTDHSVTVNAIASQAVEAYFEYGTAPGVYPSHTTATLFPSGAVEVVLDGLAPNTRYYYRKRHRPSGSSDDFIAGDEHSFYTQRAQSVPRHRQAMTPSMPAE